MTYMDCAFSESERVLRFPYACRYHPNAPCNKVSPKLQEYMVKVSHRAFPLYVTVVSFGEVFRKLGWSRHCESIEDCGGWAGTALNCIAYFLCVELLIFLDHYYLLHKFEWGKRVMKHSEHHVYKKADELNAWSAYAFAPQDGWSQGLPLALVTCVVRVPLPFVFFMEARRASSHPLSPLRCGPSRCSMTRSALALTAARDVRGGAGATTRTQ
uniref:Fatty acid hydroxylase domain-containing protein n=1 Tax=Chrysotila carterae TaxID=13221 RepID=A0A7S4EY31_CHRCT